MCNESKRRCVFGQAVAFAWSGDPKSPASSNTVRKRMMARMRFRRCANAAHSGQHPPQANGA